MATTTLTSAVVATGGKQYIVSEGSVFKAELLTEESGNTVTFDTVTFAIDSKNQPLASKDLSKVRVSAEVLEHGKGKKIRVFKFKSKKRYRRTQGHRQQFTKLKVTGISLA